VLAIKDLQIQANSSRSDPLLDGLSFEVGFGEVVGLMGPSGCGKTTLLRSIVGLIDPAGGDVTYNGKRPEDLGWPVFRRRVSLVAQRPVLFEGTVCENLLRPKSFNSIRFDYGRTEAEDILGRVGLADKWDAQATTLSEGEAQRVCLARAVLTEPNHLLLDEPTSALDEGSIGLVEAMLREHLADGPDAGVLLVTHDRAFAESVCTRVIDLAPYMPRGKAVADA